jgi:hypothetical protein
VDVVENVEVVVNDSGVELIEEGVEDKSVKDHSHLSGSSHIGVVSFVSK